MAESFNTLTYGKVIGRFVALVADSTNTTLADGTLSDADDLPDVIGLSARVTFTPSVPKILVENVEGGPTTILLAPVIADLDYRGVLRVGGNQYVKLAATDNPAANPTGFTYRVSFDNAVYGTQEVGIKPFDFKVPGGTTVDLTKVAPIPQQPGMIVVRDESVARAAQEAAEAASAAADKSADDAAAAALRAESAAARDKDQVARDLIADMEPRLPGAVHRWRATAGSSPAERVEGKTVRVNHAPAVPQALLGSPSITSVDYRGYTWRRFDTPAGGAVRFNLNGEGLPDKTLIGAEVTFANPGQTPVTVSLDVGDAGYVNVTLAPGETRTVNTSALPVRDGVYQFVDIQSQGVGPEVFLYTDVIIEYGKKAGRFFDGNTPDTDRGALAAVSPRLPGAFHRWTGPVNGSPSERYQGAEKRTNIMLNGRVAQDTTNWAFYGPNGGSPDRVAVAPVLARPAVRMRREGGSTTIAVPTWMPVTPGKPYTFSVEAINPAAGQETTIDMQFVDGSGGTILNVPRKVGRTVGVPEVLSLTGVAPSNAVRVQARVYRDSGADGDTYVTDAIVEPTTSYRGFFDGSSTNTAPESAYFQPAAAAAKPAGGWLDSDLATQHTVQKSIGDHGGGGPDRWRTRIAVIDGQGAQNGAHVEFLLAGTGDYGNPERATTLVHVGQRGSYGISVKAWSWNSENTSSPLEFYTVNIGEFKYELWVVLSVFTQVSDVHVLSSRNVQVVVDSDTTDQPTAPAAAIRYWPITSMTAPVAAPVAPKVQVLDYAVVAQDATLPAAEPAMQVELTKGRWLVEYELFYRADANADLAVVVRRLRSGTIGRVVAEGPGIAVTFAPANLVGSLSASLPTAPTFSFGGAPGALHAKVTAIVTVADALDVIELAHSMRVPNAGATTYTAVLEPDTFVKATKIG
jgi:hypothetical protein